MSNFYFSYAIFIVLIFMFSKIAYAKSIVFLPKAFLVLPENSKVKINWIVPPDEIKDVKLKENSLRFFVDFNNFPNVLYANSLIINLLTGYLARFNSPVRDVISLDNGVLIFYDDVNMGYMQTVKNKSDLPHLQLKAIAKLPSPNAVIFRGENTIYSVVFNHHSRMYEIYLFDPLNRVFSRILTLHEPISALTGKDDHLFFANGRVVKEYSGGRINLMYEHTSHDIKELTYNSKVGLIYRTDSAVGYIKEGYAFEFLKIQNAQLFLKGTSLYVFFEPLLGVFELANIDDLKGYNYKVEKIIDIQLLFKSRR